VRSDACIEEAEGAVTVRDDLDSLLHVRCCAARAVLSALPPESHRATSQVLPPDVRGALVRHAHRGDLIEVVLDVGRQPEARFLGQRGEALREAEVTFDELLAAEAALGAFGGDNRAGIPGTLHRISAIRNRRGRIVGLTCRVGRAVSGHIEMLRDVLASRESLLFVGAPGAVSRACRRCTEPRGLFCSLFS
jgi:stage III sporulation protein SpoIIIAA